VQVVFQYLHGILFVGLFVSLFLVCHCAPPFQLGLSAGTLTFLTPLLGLDSCPFVKSSPNPIHFQYPRLSKSSLIETRLCEQLINRQSWSSRLSTMKPDCLVGNFLDPYSVFAFCNKLADYASDGNAQDHALARFARTPSPNISRAPSSDATEHQGSPGQYLLGRRRTPQWTMKERPCTLPRLQFDFQVAQELAEHRDEYPESCDFEDLAEHNVRERWKEQNIWDEGWMVWPEGNWRHEEAFDPDVVSQPESPGRISKMTGPEIEQQELQRDASRPFAQFVYQVKWRSKQLQTASGGFDTSSLNVHSKAYEMVKETWIEWGIWDDNWGVLPGRSWSHERRCESSTRSSTSYHGALPSPINANNFGSPGTPFQQEAQGGFGPRSGELSERQPSPRAGSLPRSPVRHTPLTLSGTESINLDGKPASPRPRRSKRLQSRARDTSPSFKSAPARNTAASTTPQTAHSSYRRSTSTRKSSTESSRSPVHA
jgi:hypothetical protein